MNDLLPDLFDQYPAQLQFIMQPFIHFGRKTCFHGQIVTVRCFEDNSRVKEVLATNGQGKVLLVDGGRSLNCALLGDMIALSALQNGWQGVIILGAVRDVAQLATFDLGIMALGAHPQKTNRQGRGELNVALQIGEVHIGSGMYLYADQHGVAISHTSLTE